MYIAKFIGLSYYNFGKIYYDTGIVPYYICFLSSLNLSRICSGYVFRFCVLCRNDTIKGLSSRGHLIPYNS